MCIRLFRNSHRLANALKGGRLAAEWLVRGEIQMWEGGWRGAGEEATDRGMRCKRMAGISTGDFTSHAPIANQGSPRTAGPANQRAHSTTTPAPHQLLSLLVAACVSQRPAVLGAIPGPSCMAASHSRSAHRPAGPPRHRAVRLSLHCVSTAAIYPAPASFPSMPFASRSSSCWLPLHLNHSVFRQGGYHGD